MSWQYRVGAAGDPMLEVTVEEVHPPRYLIADENSRAMTAMVITSLLFISLIALTIYFRYFPEDLWSAAGHVARWAGAILVLTTVWWLIPTRLKLDQRAGFLDMLYRSLFAALGWVLLFAWLAFARYPPGFHGSHTEYVTYAHALADKFKSDNWPLLLAALPWAAVAFKMLGFETAEKASEAVASAAKE